MATSASSTISANGTDCTEIGNKKVTVGVTPENEESNITGGKDSDEAVSADPLLNLQHVKISSASSPTVKSPDSTETSTESEEKKGSTSPEKNCSDSPAQVAPEVAPAKVSPELSREPLKIKPSSSSSVGNNLDSFDPSPNSNQVHVEKEKDFVTYKGKPVGTLAAVDDSVETLNYNQVSPAYSPAVISPDSSETSTKLEEKKRSTSPEKISEVQQSETAISAENCPDSPATVAQEVISSDELSREPLTIKPSSSSSVGNNLDSFDPCSNSNQVHVEKEASMDESAETSNYYQLPADLFTPEELEHDEELLTPQQQELALYGLDEIFSDVGRHAPHPDKLYKTRICDFFYSARGCKYGASCKFAHDPDEMRDVPVCKFYLLGRCVFGGACKKMHT